MDKKALRLVPDLRVASKFVGAYLPLDVHKALRMEAARQGTSASQIYRKAVEAYLSKVKRAR